LFHSDSDSGSDRLCIDENEREKDRKRRGDSADRDEKELKKPKIEPQQKTPEKKPNHHDCLKPKLAPRLNVEIDSTSGLNFSDVLSALDTKRLKKSPKKVSPGKKSDNSPTPSNNGTPERGSSASSSSTYTSSAAAAVTSAAERTESPKRVVAKVSPYVYTLPSISASKKVKVPSVHAKVLQDLAVAAQEDRYWEDSRPTSNGSHGQAEDALSTMMAGRNQRTKVYSGVKASTVVGKMPTLFKMCLRVVQENIERLEYTGGVPFDILEPVLRRITLTQLMHVEHYNPYLIGQFMVVNIIIINTKALMTFSLTFY